MAKKKTDLPMVLVLKRTYIQRFPNGQQVALYRSDLLNQYITVPLDGSQFSNTTESVLTSLQHISESNETCALLFEDSSTLNINKECADIILEFLVSHEELIETVSESDKSFLELLEQATQISPESENNQELIEQ
jgi:hypothetical protein